MARKSGGVVAEKLDNALDECVSSAHTRAVHAAYLDVVHAVLAASARLRTAGATEAANHLLTVADSIEHEGAIRVYAAGRLV